MRKTLLTLVFIMLFLFQIAVSSGLSTDKPALLTTESSQFVNINTQTLSTIGSRREPFHDLFDYEWWLPGSEYMTPSRGYQYGKWFVLEMFPDSVHDFQISSDNPISGTDSAVLDINGSRQSPLCEAWSDLQASPDPDHLVSPDIYMNPTYMRFRFRIDSWNATNSYWRVTLGDLAGDKQSGLITQVILALEGFSPPHLWMLYKTGSNGSDWIKHEIVSSTTVSLGVVHMIEFSRYAHSTNGEIKVWLDGNEVPDLTVQNVDTSYPGGVRSVRIGSNKHYSKLSPGSWATITFDDFRVSDEYIGENSVPITRYDLTIDSSPQGRTVRVGNWIVGQTPVTMEVPEGTVPKIGIEPTNFHHWEIAGNYSNEQKELFANHSEIWPNMSPSLVATVTRAPASEGQNVGPIPTPAIYSDTRITAIYTTGKQHDLNVTSNPVTTSFTIDEIDCTTPWHDSLTEGTHTISMPSTFTIGERRYEFRNWEDDSTNPTRTVNLVSAVHITAYYDETIIPEFPTLIVWLTVLGVSTLVVVLVVRKPKVPSRTHSQDRSHHANANFHQAFLSCRKH